MKLVEAIGKMEGFGAGPHNRPTRLHNPGDIEKGKFADAHGAVSGVDSRFATFPDDATGYAALTALLQTPGYRGKTVAQCINRYAPPIENNTVNYVEQVCKWAECAPDTIIDGLLT
jgi:hypothetical protein